jgi:hypothetical protein
VRDTDPARQVAEADPGGPVLGDRVHGGGEDGAAQVAVVVGRHEPILALTRFAAGCNLVGDKLGGAGWFR